MSQQTIIPLSSCCQGLPDKTIQPRKSKREPIIGGQARIFKNDAFFGACAVEDCSCHGTRLIIDSCQFVLAKDDVLIIQIQWSNREFTKQVVVRWTGQDGEVLHAGIEFLQHVDLNPAEHRLDVASLRIDPVYALRLPGNIARRQKALPFIENDGAIQVACCKRGNQALKTLLERLFKQPVVLWECDEGPLTDALQRVYGENRSQPPSVSSRLKASQEDTTEAVNQGEALLYAAYMQQASDIHIDPGFDGAAIRFRIDGQLELHKRINSNVYIELVSYLKVMAGLDIAEKRSPQDGRISHQFVSGGRRVDVRVATLPTKYGERVTLRLLAMQADSLTLDRLGLERNQHKIIEDFLHRIQGMMIMTGPTGSGKTTTLYASIRMLLEERNVNIITIEDPIEYEIAGVAQCEVDGTEKVSFGKALRSILRHDPDVVMIGEIRDRETADIAIKAALTGHMVLGTLHTNSAAATVTRLLDMGVEPYLVAASLRLSVAQRLLRRLCRHCSIARPMTDAEAVSINRPELAGLTVHDPSGCIYCANKGYSGRIGLYEMLELHEDWARWIAEGAGEAELTVKMRETGCNSLLDDAVGKLLNGKTSVAEVRQIASSW
ncbi:MAG: GspE/PulE family protein [Gammaproteobacteria bacterium]